MKSSNVSRAPCVDRLGVAAYRVPTSTAESDGTFEWNSTTLVVVELSAADAAGIGYTYADVATATLIEEHLADAVVGRDPMYFRVGVERVSPDSAATSPW